MDSLPAGWSRQYCEVDATELVLNTPVLGIRFQLSYGWLRGDLYRRTRDMYREFAECSWDKADAASRDRLVASDFLVHEATPDAVWTPCEEPQWEVKS